jgi:PAS domain S-box-containing protein
MAQSNPPLQLAHSPVIRYLFALLSFGIALGLAILAQRFSFHNVEVPLLLFAVAVSAWYAGPGPAALAVGLSIIFFDYFFVEPHYTLGVNATDLPYFFVFISFACLVAWFSAIRRRVERELIQARDSLQIEVAERTQQASLLNLTHDSIFVRDMSNVIAYWNRGAQELYGWTAEQAVGKRSQELLMTVFPISVEDIRAELIQAGRWEGELKRTKADGTEVVVASRWSLQRGREGQPTAIMETNNDITERKQREDEIRTLNRKLASRSAELEVKNKELEAFAYSISHDLRAPLRHMSGYAELLQKKAAAVLDEKSQRYMLMIQESAKRMGNLIDDLLAFSRIGRTEKQMSRVSLEQLAREAMAEVRQETDGRDIAWKIGTLPEFYCDRSMLRLVFVNLLSNAMKFTRTRPQAQIEVGCKEAEQEVVVFVKDNGVGFDMKYVNKLFGVFQRLHTSQTFEGTGIGLATVQRIVQRHGGQVWAEGTLNQGATFYFSAPKL